MINLMIQLKKKFQDNSEDLQYLLMAGLPAGILLAALNRCFSFGEIY
jgi:hypothetical protein